MMRIEKLESQKTPKSMRYRVSSSTGLNIRDRASLNGIVVGTLRAGDIVMANDPCFLDSDGNKWIQHSRGYSMYVDNTHEVPKHYLVRIP